MTELKISRKGKQRSEADIAAARARMEERRAASSPGTEAKPRRKILSAQRMAEEVDRRRQQHQVRLEQARLRATAGFKVELPAPPEPLLIELEAAPAPPIENVAVELPAPPPRAAPTEPAPVDPQGFETAEEARLAAISAAARAQREAEQGTVTPPAPAAPEPPAAAPAPQDEPPITERGPAAETKEETPEA